MSMNSPSVGGEKRFSTISELMKRYQEIETEYANLRKAADEYLASGDSKYNAGRGTISGDSHIPSLSSKNKLSYNDIAHWDIEKRTSVTRSTTPPVSSLKKDMEPYHESNMTAGASSIRNKYEVKFEADATMDRTNLKQRVTWNDQKWPSDDKDTPVHIQVPPVQLIPKEEFAPARTPFRKQKIKFTKKKCPKVSVRSVCQLIGILMVICGISLIAASSAIFKTAIKDSLVLEEGKEVMESFTVLPEPVYVKFYLFNVTNPDGVQFRQARPMLQEIGPYVYEQLSEKVSQVFMDDGASIQYMLNRRYHFKENMSCGLETDIVTTVNFVVPMVAELYHGRDIINILWPEIERTMNVFENISVGEILFKGWSLPEFSFTFNSSDGTTHETITVNGTLEEILHQMNVPEDNIPELISENRVGYLSSLNNSYDGPWHVSTGTEGLSDYFNVLQYRNDTELPYWNDTFCDMINGTDGTQFPPTVIDKHFTPRMFVPEFCRSIFLKYAKNITFYEMQALRFKQPADVTANSVSRPDNACFCGTLGCLESGLMELTPCQGIPVVMSEPHFYQSGGGELAKYDGLSENETLHATYLDIEPNTGAVVQSHRRFQINIPLRKYDDLPALSNFSTEYNFPVFWVDQDFEMSENAARELERTSSAKNSAIGLGLFIVIVALMGICYCCTCSKSGASWMTSNRSGRYARRNGGHYGARRGHFGTYGSGGGSGYGGGDDGGDCDGGGGDGGGGDGGDCDGGGGDGGD